MEAWLSSLDEKAGLAVNTEHIRRFVDHCFSEGLGVPRVIKYISILVKVSRLLRKNFAEATRGDIEALVGRIERSHLSPWTKQNYKVALKRFYRWLRGTGEKYPPEVE